MHGSTHVLQLICISNAYEFSNTKKRRFKFGFHKKVIIICKFCRHSIVKTTTMHLIAQKCDKYIYVYMKIDYISVDFIRSISFTGGSYFINLLLSLSLLFFCLFIAGVGPAIVNLIYCIESRFCYCYSLLLLIQLLLLLFYECIVFLWLSPIPKYT